MFQTIIQYVSYVSDILPLFFGVRLLNRAAPLWIKVLLVYVVYSFLNDTALLVLDTYNHRVPIYYLLSCFTIIEYSAFSLVLHNLIENRLTRIILLTVSAAFLIFCMLNFFAPVIYSFDSLSASIEAILLVGFCIYFLYEQLNKPHILFIYQEPSFWVVVAFMIYFSGALFLFILATHLSRAERDNSWTINLILNIIKNIFFIIGFVYQKNRKNRINTIEEEEMQF